MAETWPSDIIARACDLYLQKNTSRFVSPITRTIQTLDRPGRRWIGQFNFRLGTRARAQRMIATLDKGDSFLLWDMRHPQPINGLIAGVLVNGAHLRGNTSIAIDGLPISQTHLKAGDLIGIGGKLYRLTADVAANGSGQATATINRGLLADVADNAAVTLNKPTVEMLLTDDDQQSYMLDIDRVYDITLSFHESL